MARYPCPAGLLTEEPAGDPQSGAGDHAANQDADRERSGQQEAGRGGRAGEKAGRTHLGQHAEQVPEGAEPDHGSTIAGLRTR